MMDKNMNRKNRFERPDAQETRGKAKSTMSARATTRRTDKLTSGGSTNSHSRRGIFGAFLSVLMASIMITSFALGAYADNTTDINNGGTTPVGEYDGTHNIFTVHDGKAAVTDDTIVGSPYAPYTVSNVVQSRSTNSATTFAAGLPLSTIYIDQSKISGDANARTCIFQPAAGPYSSAITRDSSGLVTYDAVNGSKKIMGGQVNTLDGELFYVEFPKAAILPNGDEANLRVTYSNARIVVDQRYDAGSSWTADSYKGKIRLATGSKISFGGDDPTDLSTISNSTGRQGAVVTTAQQYGTKQSFSSKTFKNPMVGMSIDVTYQIVDGNGTPVPGSFVFAIAGINLDRDPFRGINAGNNAAKPLWYVNDMPGGSAYHFFSEAMSINSGMVSDNIYVRSNDNGDIGDNNQITPTTDWKNNGITYQVKRINQANFWPQVTTDSNGKTKFIANASGNNPNSSNLIDDSQGSDTAYSNGFVTLADAAAGIKVTATGHGGGSSYNMNSTTFTSSTIWYRYRSGSGNHGKIELTDEGNPGGTLNTGTVLDGGKNPNASDHTSNDKPNVYVVTEGKTVTYTMTPDIGYQIKKLTVSGKEVKLTNGALQNVDLSQMKRGDTVTVETNDYNYWENPDTLETRDPTKGQGILTYNADGTYTFKFNHAKAEEEIFVEWEPVTADILAYKIWDDNNDKDGIRYDADTNNTLPKFKLQYSLNGRTWNDVTNTVNIGSKSYTLKKPVTDQTVPAGKDSNNKYVDGTYVINNDPNKNSTDPDVKKHPYTWEHLPVYTYDSNGTAGKAIQYRVVEVGDPWHSEYKDAEYYDLEIFDLTSDKVKSIDGWGIYTDGTTHYAQKSDGKYYTVNMTNGKVADTPASTQPDPDNLDPYVDSDSWTVDKAIPYQEVQAKNTHFTTEYFVEVTKKWDDKALLNQQTTSGPNQYARKDIYIVLHGETENGDVDLNGSELGTDLKKEIKTTEIGVKANVTGNKTIDNFTIYKSGSTEYALVEGDTTHADGYYAVSGNAINYTSGPVTPTPTGLTVVKKGDGTYKINDNDFGAMFEDLPTHYNGKEITYTVKETDTSGNALSEWIMTGGELSAVTDNDKNVLGYETTMRNTPDVDEIYTKVPLTLIKRDVNDSDSRLEGAEFTIYTDAVVGDKAGQSQNKKVGEKVYTKTEEDETTGTQVTTNYVIKKDANDNYKYKYYEVTSGDTVSATPANPQPISLDLTESGLLGGGEDAYTDGAKTYVLRSGSYHLVNTDGSIAAMPANPQPDSNLIKEAKDETTGAVKENVVTTNADGEAYVSFLKTGTYYIKETKAPTGYNVDPTTYAFKVDAELKSITLQSADGEHTTPWWKKLYDLIFGNSGVSYDNWAPNADKKGGTLTVDDSPIVADVLVRKYWNDSDNQDGKRPGDRENPSSTDDSGLDPELKLPTVTLQYTTGAHTATGLNVYTDGAATNPKKYVLKNDKYYEVTAEDVTGEYQTSAAATKPTSATATSETCAGLTVYTDINNKKYVIIDNAYHEVDSVDKVGSVASSPASTQPDENILNLVMDGGWTTVKVKDDNDNLVDATNKVNYVGGPVLTQQNDAYTWNDLPAYRDGKLVTYRILEEDDPAGNILTNHIYDIESNHTSQTYDKTFHLANTSGENPTALNQTVDVTNKHDPQVINIEVYKEWEDEDPADRAVSTISLYKVVNGIETVVSTGTGDETKPDTGTVPVEDRTTAIKTWKDLPTYEGGYPVTYRLKEDAIEGYNTHYTKVYKKTDNTDVDEESQDILAEDIKRTFYQQGDTLPTGKKVGDENTTAKFKILNERSVNVKVSKTWRNGANANVTYELWRTIKKESELTSSAFTSTPVSDTDPNRYYVRKTIILTQNEYDALSADEKADYEPGYVNNTDSNDILTQDEFDALDITEQSNYTLKYVNDKHDIITAETYDQMSAEKKAEYEIEATRTWSPYQGGGKGDTGTPPPTVDGWKKVAEYTFDANEFENSATGYEKTHPFNNLDIKDLDGHEYLYRVLEKPAMQRYRENQISNTEIINNNVTVSDGNVSFEVVKELDGRDWIANKDKFNFYLEAVNGKNITDADNPVDVAQDKVPMPYIIDPTNGKIRYDYTADAAESDKQVGALGRAATFHNIPYKASSDLYQEIGVGETYEFYYKVYEIYDTKTVTDTTNNTETTTKKTELDEATGHTGIKDGISYDGKVESGIISDTFKPTVHEAKVIVKNVNGSISTEVQWKNESGTYVTGAVPVYTNTYDAATQIYAHIIKQVQGREFTGNDEFNFTVENIAGAPIRATKDGSATTDATHATAATIKADTKTQVEKSGITNNYIPSAAGSTAGNYYRATRSDTNTWIKLSDLGHKTSDGKATDTFIYAFNENAMDAASNKSVANEDDLTADARKIYMKVVVTDNLDGTMNVVRSYHSDAACTDGSKINNTVLVNRSDGDIAQAGADPDAEDGEGNKLYEYIPAALFINSQTVDIPVVKEWVGGPAVEDVTLHLMRKLIPLSAEANLTYATAESASGDWETVGHTKIVPRGDFVKSDGTPDYDQGSTTTSSETYYELKTVPTGATEEEKAEIEKYNKSLKDFNLDLPKYVSVDGTTYRAVYKLAEDNTSDAYKPTYRSRKTGEEDADGNSIFLDGETLVVTNTVKATNVAKIAAVKQLLGRQWLLTDEFPFILERVGIGTYNSDGSFNSIDDSTEAKAKVPMPVVYVNSEDPDDVISASEYAELLDEDKADYTKNSTDEAEAVADGTVVDPNGNLERLARFDEIVYTMNDLIYDDNDGHMQGDFFYTMKEVIPDDAKNSDGKEYSQATDEEKKAGGFTKGGITYDGDEHTVHVKVRENRTGKLQVQIAYDYDENNPGDISTGTQFTPVYTNKYDAEASETANVDKYLMGRDFKVNEAFTFEMRPIGNAPFIAEDGTVISGEVLEKTITVGSEDVGEDYLSGNFDKLHFVLSDLPWTVGANGAKDPRGTGSDAIVKYSDGNIVAEGTKYGRFVYAVTEKSASSADLNKDSDTEYVRITVIDKGDGSLDTKVEYFVDRECRIPRIKPGTEEDAAAAAAFVNHLKRDLKATKAWDMPATSDVTLKLQWSVNGGTNWYDVDQTTWMGRSDGIKVIAKDATGTALTVEWKDLPTYSNYSNNLGNDGDEIDLNDKWIIYRIKEEPIDYVDTMYNETVYAAGDKKDTKVDDGEGGKKAKYSAADRQGSPFHTEAEDASDSVDVLYVTNFRQDLEGTAKFGVVKQYIGKVWDDEEFTFEVNPIKSALGEDADIDDPDGSTFTDYDATDNKMPTLSNNKATADTGSRDVSVNEHAANFGALTIKLSDLETDPADGVAKGIFYYEIKEVIPDGASEITEGGKTYYAKTTVNADGTGNTIKYTTDTHTVKIIAVDDGGGSIKTTVSYDDRETGQFVPVYTNYAMMPTPIEGTKTWVGGPSSEHVNGSVTIDENDQTKVTGSTDERGLSLKRKLNKSGAAEEIRKKDDAGRNLAIVWAKTTPHTTQVEDGYELTTNTEVVDGTDYYTYDEGEETYTKVDDPTGDPSAQGWYVVKYKDVTTYTYEKQEKGNGTYTVMAVDDDGNYVAPYFYAVDNDGNTYDYYIKEGTVPENYRASEDGLDITNTNIKADSVVVTKEWVDGPAIEDVTLRLMRMLVPVSELEKETDPVVLSYDNLETLSEIYEWKNAGLVYNAKRGDFTTETSKDYTDIEGFNKDLPMYVTEKGVDYRAIYKLVEDNTSDAYEISYKTMNRPATGDPTTETTEGAYYLNAGDNPVVTNTVEATNEANIAAVKQLLGRGWHDTDDFEFTLEPVGKAIYDETTGEITDIDKSDEAKAAVPMPENDDSRESATEDAGTEDAKSTTHARKGMTTVDKNGGLERLARFGAITYTTNDLVYDPVDKHYQGDFFYVMKEKIPSSVEEGVSYDTDEHTVHVKVRENRTGTLQVQIAYDEADSPIGDITTGTQFTPVFTNKIDAVTEATITKVWSDNSNKLNTRPDTLTVELWRTYKDTDNEDVHEKVTKDADNKDIKYVISADDKTSVIGVADGNAWKYTVDNLPKKIWLTKTVGQDTTEVAKDVTYYWKEVVPTGYTASASGAEVDASGDTEERTNIQRAADKATITNTYITGTITLTKKWDDQTNADKLRPNAQNYLPMLTLYAGNTKLIEYGSQAPDVVRSITDSGNNTYTITYSNLPVYDKNGQKITYKVEENVPKGYEIASTPAAVRSTTLDQASGAQAYTGTMSLTNRHEIELIDVEITKNWIDQTGYEHVNADAYKSSLNLFADGTDVTSTYVDKLSITPTSDSTTADRFTVTWSDLPKYKVGGTITEPKLEKIVYKVTETTVYGYADATYDNKGATDKNKKSETEAAYDGGEINNTQNISIDVKKTWEDNNNHDGKRGDIKVVLFRNGERLGEKTLKETDTNISKNGNIWTWTKVWENLPYADENGMTYNYTASEEAPQPWYTALFNGEKLTQILLNTWNEAKDTLIFEVTNKHDDETIGFTVDKIWDDGNDVDNVRPAKIYYRLYQNYDGISEDAKAIKTLPAGAEVSGGEFKTANDGYIEVDANKNDKTQGTPIRVTITGLPKYAAGGKEITYSIEEDAVVSTSATTETAPVPELIFGYTTAKNGSMTAGYTVTNTHTPASVKVAPVAKKAITGRKFKSGDEFTFKLKATGTNASTAPTPTPDWATITPTRGTEASVTFNDITFTGALMTDKLNAGDTTAFEYEVTEVKGGVEDISYSTQTLKLTVTLKREADGTISETHAWSGGNGDNRDTITNTFNTETALIIRKVWEDKDADETTIGTRPESITVVVTAEATVDTPALETAGFIKDNAASTDEKSVYTKEYTVSERSDSTLFNKNVWQKKIESLPALDAADAAIKYTVDEKDVPNYTKAVKDDEGRWIIMNTYSRTTFTGTKVWDDGNLKHDNATELKDKLTLYRTTDTDLANAEWTKVSENYHIHWNGNGEAADDKYSQSFTITGLPEKAADGKAYTYRVVESNVGDDYATTYSNVGDYEGMDNAVYNGGTVINTNQDKVTIKARKVWAGDSEDKSKRQAVKFQLVRTVDGSSKNVGDSKDATATSESFEPIKDQDNDDYVVWKDLPTVVEGKKATYDVKEVSVPDGYTSKVEYGNTDNDNWTETKPNNWNNKIRITNTLNDTAVNVPVRKVWADNDDQDNVRPDSIEVRIYIDANNNGEYDDGEQVKVKDGKLDDTGTVVADLELNDSNNWKRLFKDLPKTDTNGKAVTYKVAEMDDGTAKENGDTAFDGKYNVSIEGDMASGYVITNSNDPDTVSVTAIKQWYGDADVKEDTRKDVRLLLLGHVSEDREDQLAYVGVTQKIKVDMDADVETDAGSVTWTGLPKYVDGQEIIWTVIEESVPGYTFSVGQRTGQDGKTTDGKAEFVVTNEYIGSVSEVTATKIWEDGNNRDGKRDDVWFQLYRKIGDSDEEKVGEPKKVAVDETAADGAEAGEVTWTKLPEIIAETIDDGTTEEVYEPVEPAPAVDTEITEEWYESEGSDGYKPTEDETVQEGKTYYTKTIETIKKEMPERSVVYWVKEVNADGDEVAPDGYESTVVQTEPGVFEVRNVHNPETISVFAKKVWNDEEDAEGIRPDHITIRLKADEEKKEDAVITSKADGWNQGESAGDGNSVYEFANLPKYKDGEEIEYSVVELDSDDDTELDGTSDKDKTSYNYTVAPITGSGTAADPYVLINTYNPADEIKLTVTKKWEGDEKVKKTSRKDIELTLIEVVDGARKEKETVTLELPDDVDGEMSYTWDNLDATYKHKAVSYTVEERNIPEGYTASVGDTRKVEGKDNEFTIEVTNTYHEVIPSEDVIYVDPKNASGRMVVKSTTYDSPTEASAAANNKTGKPADPKHKNVRFLGWDVNYDNNGNYVLVATYSDIPSSPTPVVSYIDPQSGKVLVSKQTDDPSSVKAPANPKAKNMQFTGWAVVTDSAGNTMYLAQYECDCSNGNGGKDVDKSNVDTGDDAMLTVWMLLFVMAVSFMVLTMMLRNRSINAVRDTYKPKH